MRYGIRSLTLAIALAGTQVACERTVGINVKEGPTLLVVEARLEVRRQQELPATTQPVLQRVSLTTTAPYFRNTPAPPARGAVVQVVDDSGRTIVFPEAADAPGVYTSTALAVAVGRRYTLRIQWQGDQYESSQVVQRAVPIDSLYFVSRPNQTAATDGLRATLDAKDPPVERNFYLWEQWIDGVRQVSPDTATRARAVASDEILNGRQVLRYQPYGDIRVNAGQLVQLRQYALSSAAYDYYFAFNGEINGDGSPFAFPGASLSGNVSNKTNPKKRALGYFIASEYSEQMRQVPTIAP